MKRISISTHFAKKITSIACISMIVLGSGVDTLDAYAPDTQRSSEVMDPVLTPKVDHHVEELKQQVQALSKDSNEILWLARVLYSETKRADEQRIIAWVVRNRLEIGTWGNSYQRVALSSHQFSGLNSFDRNYAHNISRDFTSTEPAWKMAVEIAKDVYYAPASERPIGTSVTHFYSPNVVSAPAWAQGKIPVHESTDGTDFVRFAFFENIR
jgi:hypothetical protein